MSEALSVEAVLRAAARRGWLPDSEASQLPTILAVDGATCPSLRERLRRRGAETVAQRLEELLPPTDHPGFGAWRPLARLGGGSMGAVWLATGDGRELVVVKTAAGGGTAAPPIDSAGSVWNGPGSEPVRTPARALDERFAREVRITTSLTHRRIVACRDGGITPAGIRFLVLDWVPGGDLSAWLKAHGRMDLRSALSVADQLADALDHAHGKGLVHRDVKPANVFLAGDGGVLLADFGLARPTSAGATRLTMAGIAVGTPTTMAPEQIDGRGELDGRADLYGLGCLLWECLAGRPPFTGRSAEVMHAHRTAPPPDLRQQRDDVGEALAGLMRRLMAKNRDDRPASAAIVREQLAPLLRAQGVSTDAVVAPAPLTRTSTPAEPTVSRPLLGPILLDSTGDVAVVLWPAGPIVIGKERAPGTDLVFREYPEGSGHERLKRISRRHIRLALVPGGATLTDLGSANGSTWAGRRLSAQIPHELPPGDSGDLVLADVAHLRLRVLDGGRGVTLGRLGNRPGLAYALVGSHLSLGGTGCDLVLPGAAQRCVIAWTGSAWTWNGETLLDGAALDAGSLRLRAKPLSDWL